MKVILIGLAVIVAAVSAQLDSATQGPNPQDIATPEPEYIDIDLPPPPAAAAPRISAPPPAPIFRSAPAPAPRHFHAAPVPQVRALYSAPRHSSPVHLSVSNHLSHEPAPAHSLERDGYHYRTVRRLKYRHRY